MDGINYCQRVCTSIDICGKIAEVIFIVDLLRCVDVGNSVTCFRKISVLFKDIALDSSYISIIINNRDVKLIIFTLSIISINTSTRFWCESAPVNRGVCKT